MANKDKNTEINLLVLEYLINRSKKLKKIKDLNGATELIEKLDRIKKRILDEVWLSYQQKQHIEKIIEKEKKER